jgi:hypothetical protein
MTSHSFTPLGVRAADRVLTPTRYMLQSNIRFEVFTAVTMKNAVFWDVTPCGSCGKNRRSGETCRLHHRSGNRQ